MRSHSGGGTKPGPRSSRPAGRGLRRAAAVLIALAGLEVAAFPAEPASQAAERRSLRADIAALADASMEGRHTGTRGADRAAAYLARRFGEAGLQPLAQTGARTQGFPVLVGTRPAGPPLLAYGAAGALSEAAPTLFVPLAMSGSGRAEAGAAFLGFGIHAPGGTADDYRSLDVHGRAVFVLRGGRHPAPAGGRVVAEDRALRSQVRAARAAGASAVLLVGALDPLSIDFEDAGIPAFAVAPALAARMFAQAGIDLARLEARAREGFASRDLPGLTVRFDVAMAPVRATALNVLGEIPGRSRDGPVILLGAHYDALGIGGQSINEPDDTGALFAGADDNASGVAAVLAAAGHLRLHPLPATIVVAAFAGEEEQQLGSRFFVAHPPIPLSRIRAMINLDMVGRYRGELDLEGPAADRFLPQAERLAAPLGLRVRRGRGNPPSDHRPFEGAGVPSMLLTTGIHADYHRPTDTPGKIDFEHLGKIVHWLDALVRAIGQPD
jgi:Peptidase family M28